MKGFAINAFVGCVASLAAAAAASGSFVGFFVSSTSTACVGQNLVVYTLTARFDGATDTVERAFNLTSLTGDGLVGYWHKDKSGADDAEGVLSQDIGSWDPTQTGSASENRPFDSYLTIGGIARHANSSSADLSWFTGGNADARGWNRADLPDNGALAWLNAIPSNAQGRVGNSFGVATTDVRLGQFVLSAGHSFRELGLEIAFTDGTAGGAMQYASGTFAFGTVPTPGAIALLTVAGLVSRRRRR